MKTKPGKRGFGVDEATVEMREFMVEFHTQKPGPLLLLQRGLLSVGYVFAGKASTLFGRMARFSVALAVFRLDTRLRKRYDVKLRVLDSALARLVKMSNPPDGSTRFPAAVVSYEIEKPVERLVRSRKARRGDTIGVQRHSLGNRLQIGAVKGN